MPLFRLAAVVLFVLAALGAFDVLVHARLETQLGLAFIGLACFVASFGYRSSPTL